MLRPSLPPLKRARADDLNASRSAADAFAELLVRAGRLGVPPRDVALRGRLEIPELARVAVRLTQLRQHVAKPLVAEQQLASALIEELGMEDSARDERGDHLPV